MQGNEQTQSRNQGYFTQCSNLTLGPQCPCPALCQSPRALGRRCTGDLDIWRSPVVTILGVLRLKALFHISEIGTVISLRGKEAVCLELILGWGWEFSSHRNCIDMLAHRGFRVDIHLSKSLFMPKEHVGCGPIVWTCSGHFISVNSAYTCYHLEFPNRDVALSEGPDSLLWSQLTGQLCQLRTPLLKLLPPAWESLMFLWKRMSWYSGSFESKIYLFKTWYAKTVICGSFALFLKSYLACLLLYPSRIGWDLEPY